VPKCLGSEVSVHRAFQSTPHRLLHESFLMLCSWYRPALEPIINSQTGDP